MSIQQAWGLFGGPQNGAPQTAPTTAPTTAPGGPATRRPVPAPKAAPTLSACELVGAKAISRIGAAAKRVLRIVVSCGPRWCRPNRALQCGGLQRNARTDDIFSVGCCGTATASDRTAPILSDLQQFDLLRDCRFPPPWIVDEHNNACFIVKDATGQALSDLFLLTLSRKKEGSDA